MLNLSGIKNIIFDFGGVVINIDFNLTYKAFSDLGIPDLNNRFSQAKQTSFFDQFEKGLISPENFRKEAKKLLNLDISNQKFDAAWNAMILDIPIEHIKLLKKLKSKFRTFLLSNSNKIHYDLYLTNLQSAHRVNNFNDLFEKAYFSFHLGMIKPSAEIFEFVVKTHGLKKGETLFIDDSIQHIKSAQMYGLKTYFLDKVTITQLFQ